MKAGVVLKPSCFDPSRAQTTRPGGRVEAGVVPKPPCCDPEPSSSHKVPLTGQEEDERRWVSLQSLLTVIQSRAQTSRLC